MRAEPKPGARPILRKLPLGVQVLLAVLCVGGLLWVLIDRFQTERIRKVFLEDFTVRLEEQARNERLRIDRRIRAHLGYVQMLAGLAEVRSHLHSALAGRRWEGSPEIVEGDPPWLPSRSLRRLFAEPDGFLLLGEDGRARLVYRQPGRTLPARLSAPGPRILGLIESEPLLLRLEEGLFLIAGAPLGEGGSHPRLLAAVAIDEHFLREAQDLSLQEGSITAVVSGVPQKVLISSDHQRAPPGTPVEKLQESFLITGKGFLDYGFSEVQAGFATLVPRVRIEELTRPVLASERAHRTYLAVALSAFFLMVLLYVTLRMRRLARRVADVTAEAFGVPAVAWSGDELYGLERQVERLSREVVTSRAALEAETREKMRLLADTNVKLQLAKRELEHMVAERTEDLRRALAESQAATRAKSRFLAAASHDLRQPLQAARLFESLLKQKVAGTEAAAMVDRLSQSLDITEGLLSTLLDMSRIEAGVIVPSRSRFALSDFFAEIVRSFELLASENDCRLRSVPCRAEVEADRVLLGRIVRNLVANAIRHGAGGRVVLGARRAGGSIRIEVWDEGPGIPDHDMPLIFEEFYQLGNPERDREKGLGLGLAIAQKLSTICGFTLAVRSAVGKGSVFSVAIPLAPARRAATAADLSRAVV